MAMGREVTDGQTCAAAPRAPHVVGGSVPCWVLWPPGGRMTRRRLGPVQRANGLAACPLPSMAGTSADHCHGARLLGVGSSSPAAVALSTSHGAVHGRSTCLRGCQRDAIGARMAGTHTVKEKKVDKKKTVGRTKGGRHRGVPRGMPV